MDRRGDRPFGHCAEDFNNRDLQGDFALATQEAIAAFKRLGWELTLVCGFVLVWVLVFIQALR